MTKIKLSVRISSKISKGSESSNVNYDIDTEENQTNSIKSEVQEAFKQIEAKLIEELGDIYGEKQSSLEDYS